MNKKIIGIVIMILLIVSVQTVIGNLQDINNLYNPNLPPEKPTIDNPPTVKVNEEYKFYVHSFDPNYDHIYFKVNYWDGTITDWIGPFYYNATVKFSHIYTKGGFYQLSVTAKDDPNRDGDLSDGLESQQADSYVNVSKSKEIQINKPLFDFLKKHLILFQIIQRIF